MLNQVEAGRLHLPGIHPETVGATRKLISVVVWLFALSAAYPFLPGANSLAFKGISVFFGLMLTLGSAGVMNHAMSGLVLQVKLRAGQSLAEARNELHSNIQDVFNEFNVQIMSPNFVMQPEGAVVVTEDNCYAASAEKPENKQRE